MLRENTNHKLIEDAFFPERSDGLTYLEQLTALLVNCENPSVPYLYRKDFENKKVIFIRGACKLWSCPQCSMKNAQKWIARIIGGVNNLDAENWYFATVTAHKNWRNESSLVNLRDNWHKLRKRMVRAAKKNGEKMFYVRVWEMHKDKSFHMHLITNTHVKKRWLKDSAAECGLGYQADIQETKNAGQCAGYVAKYMVKMQRNALYDYPKGARRIEVSRNWIAWKEYDNEIWQRAGTLDEALGLVKFFKYIDKYDVDYLILRRDEDKKND